MSIRKRTVGLAVAGSALFLASCGGGSNNATNDGPTSLTVGLMPIVDVVPIYMGMEQGFYEEQGIEIDPVVADGGAAIIPAITSGDYDVGFSNYVSLMIAMDQGLSLDVIAPGVGVDSENESSPADEIGYCHIMASGGSGVEEIGDLEGETIAVNTLSTIGMVTITGALEELGIDTGNVDFVEMPFPDMPAALQGESLDVGWTCEPFVTMALTDDNVVPLLDNYTHTHPNLAVAGYFSDSGWIEENPEAAEGFVQATRESMEYAAENPDLLREAVIEHIGIDEEVAADIVLPDYPLDSNEESIEVISGLSVEQGVIEAPVSPDDFYWMDAPSR